ncbi:long-chain-fatty-acid--CoA ligase [Achromobacter sp. GG226]|uniref:long-chain-fatty-acid--CoA ligase n=1 Tax=Verticiella alkaliphila TaxID=2779529 RepID=UPI001C0CA843|nr:long-chain-fatty-acid--CoA ligase [Verticiella sp. GG226]MBU4612015.1 long-chain-fatty-acid--CoA ligase [Verticiella sp. GG226]
MQRPWLAQYPEGVPAEIPADRPGSLVELINDAFARYADRTAYVCLGKSMTFAQTAKLSSAVAVWLQGLGLPRGARVAIMMPNVLQYMVCATAILRAGYVVVNVNPLYTPRELTHQLVDSGAQAIFILENFATTLQKVLPQTQVEHIVVTSMGDLLGGLKGAVVNLVVRHVKKMVPPYSLPKAIPFKQVLQAGAGKTPTLPDTRPDDTAFLQYTGGTTGLAKGAILTHDNIISNILQNALWSVPLFGQAGTGAQLTTVSALPLYHIFALTGCGMYGIYAGMRNLLIPNPRDIPAFIKALRETPVNIFPAVNTLFNALVNHPEFSKVDMSGLKLSLGGGMAIQKAVAEKWKAATGCHVLEAYGLSETSPGATINPVTSTEYNGTIGLPIPSTEVAILGEDDQPVPIGQPGEIAIRGPQVMPGYWNMPDETAKVMTPDGFFKTGDIGIMDEQGYTRIVDRKKDMILVSGFNVYPNEIEGLVAQHPGVLEVAAVGVPDEHSGEVVKLFVVKKDPNLTEAELKQYCHDNLTGYKRPRHIEFRDELPKTNVGKILRRALRDEPAKEQRKAA